MCSVQLQTHLTVPHELLLNAHRRDPSLLLTAALLVATSHVLALINGWSNHDPRHRIGSTVSSLVDFLNSLSRCPPRGTEKESQIATMGSRTARRKGTQGPP